MNTANNAFRPFLRSQPPGLFARFLALMLSAAFVVIAFMFSLIALVAIAVGVVVFAGWLWWKMRPLRKAMRTSTGPAGQPRRESWRTGEVIEGEAQRTDDMGSYRSSQLPLNQ